MSAFLDLLNAYAIWIYIASVVVILVAIKMLVDSRRQARTTMFTLEQEQASDQAFRAVLLMAGTVVVVVGLTAVNRFVTPARPTTTPVAVLTTAVPYTPPVVPPTFTAVPTLTSGPASPTPSTSTVTPTKDAQPTVATPKPTPVPPPATVESAVPTPPPVNPQAATYPKPQPNRPVNGDHISAGRIQFIWGQDGAVPQQLPPGQFYKVTVQYTDRNTNVHKTLIKCSSFNSVDTKQWGQTLGDAQGNAVNGQFTWFVIVMQVPSASPYDCDAGAGSPISPPSDTASFFWQ